jgi:putative ABC transport system ATP-binding protein
MIEGRTPLFEVRGLSKVYRMGEVEVVALADTDVDIFEGEIVVVLGPSGSGKSTLLNLLGGMDSPTTGSIHFRGRELAGLASEERTLFRRRHVGFVFQFYNLVPSLTALENVAMATEIAPDPRDPARMLSLVDLDNRRDHFPSQLSGGEQQRVAIARALAKNPDLLLCDEPTGALDDTTGRTVLRLLRDANCELGTTVALITHNAGIGAMGDRVLRMRSGRIAAVEENADPADPETIEW